MLKQVKGTAIIVRFLGAILVAAGVLLGVIAWAYHADARQLLEFYDKRRSVQLKLDTFRVCLDMLDNPERWGGTGLRVPCEYDAKQLRDIYIPEYEDALRDWDRLVSDREALLRARKSGRFGFLAKRFGDPYN